MYKVVNIAVYVVVSLAVFSCDDLLSTFVVAFQHQYKHQLQHHHAQITDTVGKIRTPPKSLHLQSRQHDVVQNIQEGRTSTSSSSSHNRRFRRHRATLVPFNAATNPTPPQSSFLSSSSNEEQKQNQYDSSSSWDDIYSVGTVEEPQHHDDLTVADKSILVGCATFTILAFASILRLSEPGSWRYFLAGGICAMVSHAIPTPIDVIKASHLSDLV
jgi:hypothetical protein